VVTGEGASGSSFYIGKLPFKNNKRYVGYRITASGTGALVNTVISIKGTSQTANLDINEKGI
jgi:hypothetical protein